MKTINVSRTHGKKRIANLNKFLSDRMKKSCLPLLFTATMCFLAADGIYPWGNMGNVAYASAIVEIDGMKFWNGDMNYPIHNTGNKIGSALDLSSAYIVSNDENELIIAVSDVGIDYTENRILTVNPLTFKENKQSGMVYCCFENSGACRNVKRNGPSDWLNDVYYYLKTSLELN